MSGGFTPQEFQFGDFILESVALSPATGDRSHRLEKLPMELLIFLETKAATILQFCRLARNFIGDLRRRNFGWAALA
jgi:hypothetical protein